VLRYNGLSMRVLAVEEEARNLASVTVEGDRDSSTVEVFARLRCKPGGSAIETIRGPGYCLEADR
jgi:DNA-binding response OmpR family regulator